MSSRLLREVPKEDHTSFRKELAAGNRIVTALVAALEREIVELAKTSAADYDTPSWSHKQAHLNGKLDSLKHVTSMLKQKDK